MTAPLTLEEVETAQANDRIGTTLVLANDAMSIWHIRLAPGDTLPAHRHDRPYFWTVLTDGKGRSRYGDGRSAEVSYRAGDTEYFDDLGADNGFTHDLLNTGDEDLVFVTTEFNQQKNSKGTGQ